MGQKTERFFERGKEFFDTGNNEQALRLFNQVLNREPGHLGALSHKALLVTSGDDVAKAESFLTLALDQHPEDDDLHQIAGSFYITLEEFELAEEHLRQSVELNDENVLAYYGLGILSARYYSDHKQAIQYFSQALDLDPTFAGALFNRGCSYFIEGKMKPARQDFIQAGQLNHPGAEDMLDTYFNVS